MLSANPACPAALVNVQDLCHLFLGQSECPPDRLDSVNEVACCVVGTVADKLYNPRKVPGFWLVAVWLPIGDAGFGDALNLTDLFLVKASVEPGFSRSVCSWVYGFAVGQVLNLPTV